MSFLNRHKAFCLTPGGLYSSLTKIDEVPSLTNDGWDGLTVSYVQHRTSCTAENLATEFPVGAQLGSRNWWITAAKCRRIGPGFWQMDVDFKGWASSKPYVIKVGAAAESQTGENMIGPRFVGDTVGGLFAKVETHENMPTISVTFLTKNLFADSQTDMVGKAVTPPVSIAVPTSVWSGLTAFVWHWPNGWVLMGEEQERLPGSPATLVTHTYKYIRDKTPG